MDPPDRGKQWLNWRHWGLATLLVLAAWDFLGFRARVAGMAPLAEGDKAEAIVVLTGGSGMRIAEGMRLLEEGRGERLLITGVNRDISRQEVAKRAGGQPSLYECCVDIGYEAETTQGNAVEAAGWSASHGFDSLLIVTSDYHMPRSLIHLREAMDGVQLQPAPVRTKIDAQHALSDARSFRGLATEWAKWRVTWAAALFR